MQAFGSVGLVAPDVMAQRDRLVAVLSLYTGRDVCTVQMFGSNDGWGGNNTVEGPIKACPGGIVVTEIMNQRDAAQAVADSEAPSAGRGAGSNGNRAIAVRTVELQGDASVDEEAVQEETSDLHELAAAASGSSSEDFAGSPAPGYMAPGARGEFLPARSVGVAPAPARAASCRDGNTNQVRRAGIHWNHDAIGVTIRANVWYERVSCANWKITEIEAKLLPTNYPRRIWLKDFEYTKVWSAAQSRDLHQVIDLNCRRVHVGKWTEVRPKTLIQGNGTLQMESIDTNPNAPTEQVSCQWAEGTSAVSLWIYLEGGTW